MKRRELLKAAAVSPMMALAQQADWKPLVLDAHQNETVIALSDLIIPATDTPGAKAANVNRFVDLFLSAGSSEQRDSFFDGMGWLDGYCNNKFALPFVKLAQADQIAVLKQLDGAQDASLRPGANFFRAIKMQTSRIYYNTRIGHQELNKGGRVPKTFACATSARA